MKRRIVNWLSMRRWLFNVGAVASFALFLLTMTAALMSLRGVEVGLKYNSTRAGLPLYTDIHLIAAQGGLGVWFSRGPVAAPAPGPPLEFTVRWDEGGYMHYLGPAYSDYQPKSREWATWWGSGGPTTAGHFGVPFVLIVPVTLPLPVLWVLGFTRERRRRRAGLCPGCG